MAPDFNSDERCSIIANASFCKFDMSSVKLIEWLKSLKRSELVRKVFRFCLEINSRSPLWFLFKMAELIRTRNVCVLRPKVLIPVFLEDLTWFIHTWNQFRQMVRIFSGFNSVALLRSVVLTRRLHCRSFLSSQISEIMKLYTDRGNPFLLSILAAKNLAGVPLTVQHINYEGQIIFSSKNRKAKPELVQFSSVHPILFFLSTRYIFWNDYKFRSKYVMVHD